MFRKRDKESQDDSTDGAQIIQFLKRIATMLISSIRFFAEDSVELRSRDFRRHLNVESHNLESARAIDELEPLYETLKTVIFQQRQLEKEYHQRRLEEYSKIVTALIKGISAVTDEDTQFTNSLDGGLNQIGRAVELDNLKQIRHQVTQTISKVKGLMQEKKERDEQQQQVLTEQVQHLNTQLDRAKEETQIDGLTKVYNRRAFDQYIEDQLNHSQIAGSPFGIMLFDLDHFKQANDTHGHQVGDRLLIAVTTHAKDFLRADDFVARYGGDEFAIVLRAPSIGDAKNILDQFRETVSRRKFRYRKPDGTDDFLNVTISGGVAWSSESYKIWINRLLIRRRSPLSLILEKELVAFRSGTGIR